MTGSWVEISMWGKEGREKKKQGNKKRSEGQRIGKIREGIINAAGRVSIDGEGKYRTEV
jgi:hypothetical protein